MKCIRFVVGILLSTMALKVASAALLFQAQEIRHPNDGTSCSGVQNGRFGHSLALGDIDGDGRDDMVVAARGNTANNSSAFIFYSTGTRFSTEETRLDVRANGVGLADVNNDGFKDVIVIANAATIYVFHGGTNRFGSEITPANASWTKTFTVPPPLSGSVSTIDVNADGFDDIIVGMTGEAHVFYGSPIGLPADLQSDFIINESPVLTNNVGTDGLFYRISGGFQVVARDGNLCDATSPQIPCGSQFVIGVPGAAIDTNRNQFIDSAEENMGIALVGPRWQFLSGDKVRFAEFGYQLGHAGDVNGDGETDLIISAKPGSTRPAKVFVYLGKSEGFSKMRETNSWAVEAPVGGDFLNFGAAVSSAGDINADGYDDIIIGDPRYDNLGGRPQTEVGWWGRAFLFLGGPPAANDPAGLGLNPTPNLADVRLDGKGHSGEFGYAFAHGDINGDGASDIVVGDPRGANNCLSGGQQLFTDVGIVWVYLADVDLDGDGRKGASQGDCDDHDPTVYLGAPEIPDGKDNDCDGLIDEVPFPEIAVEQPSGNDLVDGTTSINFGVGLVEADARRTFTIRNTGNTDLTGLVITFSGANAADFTVIANPTAPVAPAGNTTFTVSFSPSTPGVKTAALHIANNDYDEAPFDITLTGSALSLLDIAQQAYVKQSNTEAGDNFGFSVAAMGDIVIIGAPLEDSNATGVNGNQANDDATDSGAAYIFVRIGTSWTQQAYLKAFNPDTNDMFGYSVAISSNAIGPTVVVGAIGESSADGNPSDNSATNSGAAYVFARIGANWSQQAYLKASNPGEGDWFGHSVSISGDTLVVGSMLEDSNATGIDGDQLNNNALDAGAAYVFVRSGVIWTQQAYLKAADSDPDDRFGRSVAISGNTVVVGVPRDDSPSANPNGNTLRDAGAAYVFERGGTLWLQRAYLKASNPGMDDRFGYDVSVSGNTAVVSAVFEDSGGAGVNGDQDNNDIPQAGAAYVFVRTGSRWIQQAYLKASNPGTNDQFGASVSAGNDTIAIGATLEDSAATGINGDQSDNSRGAAGAAYVFVRTGTSWTQQAYVKASNAASGDQFGTAISVSGGTIVVGAPFEDSNATGINGVQNNNSAVDSGAVYIFTGFCPGPRLTIERNSPRGYTIRASGGCTHRLQRAPSLTGPWANLGTISSGDDFVDILVPPGQAFYRTVQP